MHKYGKLVASVPHTDEKGSMAIPPKMSLEMSIRNNREWVEIPLEQTKNKETER